MHRKLSVLFSCDSQAYYCLSFSVPTTSASMLDPSYDRRLRRTMELAGETPTSVSSVWIVILSNTPLQY
jgi:hypothetical protein